jgi:hypothetical protein
MLRSPTRWGSRRAAGRGALGGGQPPGRRRRHPALPALNPDQISSRTVAYGLLTRLLAGGYAGIALGLGRLLGRESSLVVAAATLAVVTLFQPARGDSSAGRPALQPPPLRHRPHRGGVATRLRDQLDLTTLAGELLAVVNQTVQPTRTSLWLRPQGAAGATDGTAAHGFLSRR